MEWLSVRTTDLFRAQSNNYDGIVFALMINGQKLLTIFSKDAPSNMFY